MTARTSAQVAKLAGKLLNDLAEYSGRKTVSVWSGYVWWPLISAKDLKAICASALTQAKDKKGRKTK